MPRRWPIRRILVALIVLGILACIFVLLLRSRLEIGRETTFVTGPLTPDGWIDYAAALHQRLSDGVKAEDNAAILLDQAFGPSAIPPELTHRYFEWISTDPLPEQGDYVLSQGVFMQQKLEFPHAPPDLKEAMTEEFQRSHEQPWTRRDCPIVAEWLDANVNPLELIERAAMRSQYYSPLVTNDGLVQGEIASTMQNLRESARLLVTRAMFRLGDNDIPGAWSDLLVCHRLARLSSQRAPGIVSFQTAMAVESIAARGDEALVAHGLSLGLARKCLDDHAQLLPFGSLVDLIDERERLVSLDAILLQKSEIYLGLNAMLRRTNHLYDDWVSAMKQDHYEERIKMFTAIENDLKQRIGTPQKPVRQIVKSLVNPGESIGDVLLALLQPQMVQAVTSEVRIQVRHDLVQIGLAQLARYCRD